MKKLLIVGIAAACFSAAPANAQAPIFNWSGFYVGGHVGYEKSKLDVLNPAFPPGFNFKNHDAVFGGHIGAQQQWGQLVLGLEVDLTRTFQDSQSNGLTCFAPGPQLTPGGLGTCESGLRQLMTGGGRLGWALGTWMPYFSAGYAKGNFDFKGRTINTKIVNEVADANVTGWYYGGGVEMVVIGNLLFGIDYRHYDFGSKTVAARTPGGLFLENARFDSPSSDVITARFTFLFGGGGR